jgi:hypothetical protein
MTKIFSKLDPSKLLHMIHRVSEISEQRCDVVPPSEFLQMAAFELPIGKTFKAHKHNINPSTVTEVIAQESWVILQGCVEAHFYDLDGTLLERSILREGDCSITLYGAHNYVSLEPGTLVREFKTGPYISQEHDKTFLD